MSKQAHLADGTILEFPDETPGAIMDAAVQNHIAQQKPVYESPRYGPTGPTGLQVASDQAAEVLKGIPQAITGIPGAVSGGASALAQALTGGGTGRGMEMLKGMAQPFAAALQGAGALVAPSSVQAPSDQDWQQVAQAGGAMLAGAALPNALSPLAGALASRIPSAARAGANLDRVMAAAKDVPTDMAAVNDAIYRAKQLRAAGHGSLSQGMVKLDLAQQPGAPPLTYGPQGLQPGTFDAASAAKKLASRERASQTGMMQAQVKEFARALQDANRAAAEKVGMGDVFDQAMQEYRRAATLGRAADIAKQFVMRAAMGAALAGGGAAGYDIYRTLRGER